MTRTPHVAETAPKVAATRQVFSTFADRIADLEERRKQLGLTQRDVARLMGTKQSAVSAIESSSANPTVQRLQRYARVVGARLELSASPVPRNLAAQRRA